MAAMRGGTKVFAVVFAVKINKNGRLYSLISGILPSGISKNSFDFRFCNKDYKSFGEHLRPISHGYLRTQIQKTG